ncbi:hypothetical protein [Rhodococcus maanshanensis]|uniref:Uncharacterized protein n=1 Tax=Rhodococcus maanshanensis TaxID=183556 RepID=A0A1H7PP84_9NOCA|nr:hypothetical protein [Rhodococcus maanshanensis]SEL37406.1 hypothetical protein SAMN05444583_108115 [Rhodococcus maanshanensis]
MSYQQFEIPAVDELSEFDQLDVERVVDEPGTLILRSVTPGGDSVELVVDPLGRSVKLVWLVEGRRILDVFREGATRLVVTHDKELLDIRVEFVVADLVGALQVSLGRVAYVKDALLFQ